MNKKGQGIAYVWVYSIITLFTLGVIFIVFDQVFVAHLNPAIINNVNNTIGIPDDTKSEIFSFIDRYMTFWHVLPIILFLVIVVYMFVVVIRKERMDEQY